jgi:hypothetical protein
LRIANDKKGGKAETPFFFRVKLVVTNRSKSCQTLASERTDVRTKEEQQNNCSVEQTNPKIERD